MRVGAHGDCSRVWNAVRAGLETGPGAGVFELRLTQSGGHHAEAQAEEDRQESAQRASVDVVDGYCSDTHRLCEEGLCEQEETRAVEDKEPKKKKSKDKEEKVKDKGKA